MLQHRQNGDQESAGSEMFHEGGSASINKKKRIAFGSETGNKRIPVKGNFGLLKKSGVW